MNQRHEVDPYRANMEFWGFKSRKYLSQGNVGLFTQANFVTKYEDANRTVWPVLDFALLVLAVTSL